MVRSLLVVLLLLCASGVHAADPVEAEADPQVCPKADAEREKAPPADTAKSSRRPGDTAPVRARAATGQRGTSRWHSLLPGMFR